MNAANEITCCLETEAFGSLDPRTAQLIVGWLDMHAERKSTAGDRLVAFLRARLLERVNEIREKVVHLDTVRAGANDSSTIDACAKKITQLFDERRALAVRWMWLRIGEDRHPEDLLEQEWRAINSTRSSAARGGAHAR